MVLIENQLPITYLTDVSFIVEFLIALMVGVDMGVEPKTTMFAIVFDERGTNVGMAQRMLELMESQKGTIVDMFNMFSGGALHRFSLFALNVVPYISASIIVQLMGQIYGPWKALRNEGESGRRKLTQTSRMFAVVLAVVLKL